jgi:hypothetical protein
MLFSDRSLSANARCSETEGLEKRVELLPPEVAARIVRSADLSSYFYFLMQSLDALCRVGSFISSHHWETLCFRENELSSFM